MNRKYVAIANSLCMLYNYIDYAFHVSIVIEMSCIPWDRVKTGLPNSLIYTASVRAR